MGGQLGGMTNELSEFPSVCNKSIQAQSTDIQTAIPEEIFTRHPISEFKELSAYETEHLGRLNFPLFKEHGSRYYKKVSWQKATSLIVDRMKNTDPEKSFFYASGRSSNEAGFVLQLLARLYGTNNVNNCSYYCHQATGVALSNAIGTGTATVALKDIAGCDLFFLIGANPASNHPRLIHQLTKIRENGGKIIVINPAKEPGLVRFAVPKSAKSLIFGGTEIANEYLQPKIGTDILLFKGIAKYLIENSQTSKVFIEQWTRGFEEFASDITSISWREICNKTGISKEDIVTVAKCYARSKNTVFSWGMGMTHHTQGVENVEYIANLALLRGMIGKPNAGLLPLRGHSNVQGIGTVGVKPVLPLDVLNKIEESCDIQLPKQPGMDTLACLRAADKHKIDFAMMMGGNLFAASPNREWTEQALDKIGFKVFLTTTLNHGHVHGNDSSSALVLPVTARDEEWEATTQESMFNYLRLSDGGIERLNNVRPETKILADIGEQLISSSTFDFAKIKSHKTIREFIADTVPGLKKLKEIDATKTEFHIDNRILHTPGFHTDDGRCHFITRGFAPEKNCEDYPFTLMTVRSEGQFNTIIYEEQDTYRETDHRWSVLLSPEDIKALALAKEETVDVVSRYGVMRNVKVFTFDLPKGDAMAYFPEANVLIGDERDPRSHTPAFKSIKIAIKKRPQHN